MEDKIKEAKSRHSGKESLSNGEKSSPKLTSIAQELKEALSQEEKVVETCGDTASVKTVVTDKAAKEADLSQGDGSDISMASLNPDQACVRCAPHWLLRRGVQVGQKVSQIGPKWEKSRIFQKCDPGFFQFWPI